MTYLVVVIMHVLLVAGSPVSASPVMELKRVEMPNAKICNEAAHVYNDKTTPIVSWDETSSLVDFAYCETGI